MPSQTFPALPHCHTARKSPLPTGRERPQRRHAMLAMTGPSLRTCPSFIFSSFRFFPLATLVLACRKKAFCPVLALRRSREGRRSRPARNRALFVVRGHTGCLELNERPPPCLGRRRWGCVVLDGGSRRRLRRQASWWGDVGPKAQRVSKAGTRIA